MLPIIGRLRQTSTPNPWWPALGSHVLSGVALAACRAAVATGDRLEDFFCFSGLVILDKVADVDEPLVAGEALGGAGSGCGILDSVHSDLQVCCGPGSGVFHHLRGRFFI